MYKAMIRLKQLFSLMRRLNRVKMRDLYYAIIRITSRTPKICVRITDHGVYSGFANDYLFTQAVARGSNEEHFDELVSALLHKDDVALDVGGNIGTHAINLSRLVPNGKVFVFEPQSLVFSILQNNLLLNRCANVTAYKFALTDVDHETIYMEPFNFDDDVINNGAISIDYSTSVGDFCLTRTMDSFAFNKVDFIKLDVQGAESKVLSGATKVIENFRPLVFIELEEQYLKKMGSSTKEVLEQLLRLDYGIYRIMTDYPCDHVAVPIEKMDEFEENIIPKLSLDYAVPLLGKSVDVRFETDADQNYSVATSTV